MKKFGLLSIATNGTCQNRCSLCAHKGMQDHARSYNMGMDEISRLISRMLEVGVAFDGVSFGGPGEPLLWPHFNEAVRMLHDSGICSAVQVTTNGKELRRIASDVLPMLNPIEVSGYGYPIDESILAGHPHVIRWDRSGFWEVVGLPADRVGRCFCPGLMYYRGHIFPHCGPVVFDAANRAGIDAISSLSVPLESFNADTHLMKFDLPCRWCWANDGACHRTVVWSENET